MASGVFSQPLDLAAAGTSRWMTRHLRLAVPVLVLLICGSFAAATILQIRQSRSQAIAEARLYESRRAADLAAVTGAALDRFAEAGRLYAGNPAAPLTMAGLINIALFDRAGVQRAALRPDSARPSAPANRSAPAAQGRCRARPAAPALSAGASAPAARGGTARWPAQRHAARAASRRRRRSSGRLSTWSGNSRASAAATCGGISATRSAKGDA